MPDKYSQSEAQLRVLRTRQATLRETVRSLSDKEDLTTAEITRLDRAIPELEQVNAELTLATNALRSTIKSGEESPARRDTMDRRRHSGGRATGARRGSPRIANRASASVLRCAASSWRAEASITPASAPTSRRPCARPWRSTLGRPTRSQLALTPHMRPDSPSCSPSGTREGQLCR